MRHLKRFTLLWNGSNNMDTEIEVRRNEHYITDHIELFFLFNVSRLIRRGRFCGQDFST